MLALIAGLAIRQDDDPIARFAKFVAASKAYTLEYTVRDTRTRTLANCKYEAAKPNLEKFVCNWSSESFSYTHSGKGGISVRNDLKVYAESFAVPRIGYLPEIITEVSSLAYPMFLFPPTLKDMYMNSQVKLGGKEAVRGTQCDMVTVAGTEGASSTFWVGPDGRVWRWSRISVDQSGVSTSVFEITKFEASAPTSAAYYASKLPIGFVPYSIPGPKTRTVQTEEDAPLGTWYDVRRNTKVDVKAVAKPFAIVFTDPGCTICAKIEPFLASLRRQLKAKGCALVEVSLGTKRPDTALKDKDRTVFWDSDAAIERAFGTPGTPYFLVVDKEGVLAAGFQGYTKELESTIAKTLLAPFQPD